MTDASMQTKLQEQLLTHDASHRAKSALKPRRNVLFMTRVNVDITFYFFNFPKVRYFKEQADK